MKNKKICPKCGSNAIITQTIPKTKNIAEGVKSYCDNCRYVLSIVYDEDCGSKIDDYNIIEKAKHYNIHPSGVECIEVVEHMNFCLGNAMKYLWRHESKNGIEDLKKAVWYIEREIKRIQK